MNKAPAGWYTNPTKKVVAVFIGAWFISTMLLVLAHTDLFTKPFFSGGVNLIVMMLVMSIVSVSKLVRNYFLSENQNKIS